MDFYHENYLYDWMGSTVTRLKLKRAVYDHVLFSIFCGSVCEMKKTSIHSLSSFVKCGQLKTKVLLT